MDKPCGVLQTTAPKTFRWKVGSKNSAGRWISQSFSFQSNIFCFLIQPIEKNIQHGLFCLCETINGASKTCDLNISLTYNDSINLTGEKKSLLIKNKKPVKNGTWFMYKLAIIKTINLKEITCTFLKREIWNETIRVSEYQNFLKIILFTMEKECGVLQLRPPNTFSWKIGNKNSTCRWISRSFSIHGCSNNFCLLIQPIEKDTEFGIFYLCQANNAVLKSCNLNISLTYTHERKSLLGKNSKPVKSGPWFMYELATIKTNNLLEITGAYIKREISNETVQVLDKASVDITGESSKKRKQEESSTIEEKSSTAEQNKRINTIGLDALSGNLKDAFLSAEDTDVVIQVGEKEYRTHKVILKNRSPVFYSMLKYDMIEKNQGIIDISDCDPDIFRDFLLYLYTGKVDSMSKGNVFELYYMSDKYGVELLKLDCVDFIINNLDLDIICDVITLATRHLEREVLKHAISFFTDNAKEIFLTSNWQKYIKEYPIQANELIIKAFNKKS